MQKDLERLQLLCGGGRYNGLAEEIGGPETPGIGFAFSIERFIAALKAEEVELPIKNGIDCYFVSLGKQAKDIPLNST